MFGRTVPEYIFSSFRQINERKNDSTLSGTNLFSFQHVFLAGKIATSLSMIGINRVQQVDTSKFLSSALQSKNKVVVLLLYIEHVAAM